MSVIPRGSARFDSPRELAALLPPSLRIGTSTSAFKVEGALQTDGRGASVWDDFSRRWGTIAGEGSPLESAGHYHRVAEDLELIRSLGALDHRFSVSWGRIQPEGRGPVRQAGLAFYERMLDGLLEAGIRPQLTLLDRDLPAALAGGWQNRETALRFGDYAHALGELFGDRVDSWVTLDSPSTVTTTGYALGTEAPGQKRIFNALPAAHHQLLGHGIAVEALRAAGIAGRVGIVNAHVPLEPASDREVDRVATDLADIWLNRLYSDVLLLGRYPEAPEPFGPLFSRLATVDPGDLARIRQPLDFYGVDYAFPATIASGTGHAETPWGRSPTAASLPFHVVDTGEFPVTGGGDRFLGRADAPAKLAETLVALGARYGEALPPIVVTGLGAWYPDAPDDVTGEIIDTARSRYLAEHLAAAIGAGEAEGVRLEAVYLDSLLDGFEWSAGFTRPRGLVAVDPQTHDRTPKESYRWLRRVLELRD